MKYRIGYCTNVHAGATLAATRENLERHALAVKRLVSPEKPMGFGLWLSASSAAELAEPAAIDEFAGWLRDVGLVPFTMNGFPFGDFHQAVVKYDVYQPPWWDERRRDYTLRLADILCRLLPPEKPGTISTLPIAWRDPQPSEEQRRKAAAHLVEVAQHLARLEAETGHWICLCLEPEPGAFFDRSRHVVRFFEQSVLPGGDEATKRRHLGVCHDVCHAAVMFESQQTALEAYAAAGLRVGKLQVSSAIHAALDRLDEPGRREALGQLRGFAEDRYLHQTVVGGRLPGQEVLIDDLPQAIEQAEQGRQPPERPWRIHFHMPIYLASFGMLETTRSEIGPAVRAAIETTDVRDFELETYAWGVLPTELQRDTLAEGIADEWRWFAELLDHLPANDRPTTS